MKSEYSAFWKCVQAGGAYLFTQLCKMLILATFFPTTEIQTSGLDVLGELMKCTVDIADLVGMYFVMSRIAGKGQLKFMVAGIGWATAELVMTSKGQLKFMVAGIGWATAELVMTRKRQLKFMVGGIGWATAELVMTRPNAFHEEYPSYAAALQGGSIRDV
ncbi:TM147-like protein [Mya arenaria]|uniref:BOS complex subunit TMEM147 n=1 Tax=Mya arenaria TaxID=6604 RepID=A0ABY7E3F6_MYAAR|nr:TM147-like protein [Mya arenaria]